MPSRPFYNKSSSYRVGRGFEPPETIVDKSALNCGQGLRPDTAYFKALSPFKSSSYRIGRGLEHPRLSPKSPLNCGQVSTPETTFLKASSPFKSNPYRIGRGLEHPEAIAGKSTFNCGQGLSPDF